MQEEMLFQNNFKKNEVISFFKNCPYAIFLSPLIQQGFCEP
jgi:hypothetical protein